MKRFALAATSLLALSACSTTPTDGLGLSALEKLGTVDERFQAFNVEMVEVTGGRFWAPYGGPGNERYRQRPPINLSDPKLIALAKHLSPSLMRISGTWANNTYLEAEGENLSAPPKGFVQVLKRDQWKGVVAFAKAVDAPIVTSFAVSTGTRGPDGVWTTDQAQRLVDLTKEAGGSIYAAEFFNETNVPTAAPEMPKKYTADNYAAEFKIFKDWAGKAQPEMKILGTGGVGEGGLLTDVPVPAMGFIPTEEMAKRLPNSVDGFSYHFYGTVSQRCESMGIGTAKKDEALSAKWLDLTLRDYDFYAKIRDKYEPGKPIWNTETAQAACGGSPWASTFLDSFRYLNQNAVLAQKGVQVIMHNTLAASDYALIDQETLTPRPNYWAAVLWAKVMGTTVLASPKSPTAELRLFAHCLTGTKGGVGLLALNTGTAAQTLKVGNKATVWQMTGAPLDTRAVKVNGREAKLDDDGEIEGLDGVPAKSDLSVPGQSIAFVAVTDANNAACK
jgi:heparanase 1